LSEQNDEYRQRFYTSDAIILPMVQKGKVEETILESVPQLAIQLLNTWLLGQLQSMPLLTIFSISLSTISLTNTIWYYAYWNLFRCMSIRDVPCALSLYNYKLHGVEDGLLSFAKSSHVIDKVTSEEIQKLKESKTTCSCAALNSNNSADLELGSPSPALITEAVPSIDSVQIYTASGVSTEQTHSSFKALEAATQSSRSYLENKDRAAALSDLRRKHAQIASMKEDQRRLESEMEMLKAQLERVKLHSKFALVSANTPKHIAALETLAINSANNDINHHSQSRYCMTQAAVTIQSVTRGHIGRHRFQELRLQPVEREILNDS
jgi:uncharacterized membrane protein YdbT with pleckstrin-like domain